MGSYLVPDPREGGQDTGVGRSSSIKPNSKMQYKDPREPSKVAPAPTEAEIGVNRQKTVTLFYLNPLKHKDAYIQYVPKHLRGFSQHLFF